MVIRLTSLLMRLHFPRHHHARSWQKHSSSLCWRCTTVFVTVLLFFKIRILCTLITLFYDSNSVVVQYLVFTVNLTKPDSGYKKKFSGQNYIVNKSKSLNEIFLGLLVYFEVEFTADAYVVVVKGK